MVMNFLLILRTILITLNFNNIKGCNVSLAFHLRHAPEICIYIQFVRTFPLKTSRACRGDRVDIVLNRNPCPEMYDFVLQVHVQIKHINLPLLPVIK